MMAQAEDTELRDLVIEALEKNGSLAKIRALLRANIFLAFEDECENLKKNDTLEKVLQLPEGKFCLSMIHEFLEFCNLRNTLFVYKSETRQGKEYHYDSVNTIADKLNLSKFDREKEPILLTLMKNCLKPDSKTSFTQFEKQSSIRRQCRGKNYKDEQNSTYIVNEDSNTSHTQSDNSSDEKNKLDLRLTLDNSDTDTSSDSARGQTCSEYIPNKHIEAMNSKMNDTKNISEQSHQHTEKQTNYNYVTINKEISDNCLRDLKIITNSSTESTSYVELKPFNMLDTVLLNTPGLPFDEVKQDLKQLSPHNSNSTSSKIGSLSPNHTLNSISQSKKDSISPQDSKANTKNSSGKYDVETTEYSYDFTSPPLSGRKDASDKQSPRSGQQNLLANQSNNTSVESNQQNSPSSQSSVSLSDVADLISDRSSKRHSPNNISYQHRLSNDKSKRSPIRDNVKMLSDDSGDFSESPIPSLSNLSLDIHSD